MPQKERLYLREFGLISGPMSLEALSVRVLGATEDVEVSDDGENFVPYAGSIYENLARGEDSFEAINFDPDPLGIFASNQTLGDGSELPEAAPLKRKSASTITISTSLHDIEKVDEFERLHFSDAPALAEPSDDFPLPKAFTATNNDLNAAEDKPYSRAKTIAATPSSMSLHRLLEKVELEKRESVKEEKNSVEDSLEALPKPKVAAASEALPKPKIIAPSEALPKPKIVAPSEALPKPKIVAPSEALPKPKIVAPSEALPKPKIVAPSEALPKPKIASATGDLPIPKTPDTSLRDEIADSPLPLGKSLFLNFSDSSPSPFAKEMNPQSEPVLGHDEDPLGLLSLFSAQRDEEKKQATAATTPSDVFFTGLNDSGKQATSVAQGYGEIVGVNSQFAQGNGADESMPIELENFLLEQHKIQSNATKTVEPTKNIETHGEKEDKTFDSSNSEEMFFELSSIQRKSEDALTAGVEGDGAAALGQMQAIKTETPKKEARKKRAFSLKKVLILLALLGLAGLVAYILTFSPQEMDQLPAETSVTKAAKPFELSEAWSQVKSHKPELYLGFIKAVMGELKESQDPQVRQDLQAAYLAAMGLGLVHYARELGGGEQRAKEYAETLTEACQGGWCALGLGAYAAYQNEHKTAASWLDKIDANSPQAADALLVRAMSLYIAVHREWNLGRFDSEMQTLAKEALKLLEKVDENAKIAQIWRADLLQKLGRNDEAISLLESFLAVEPDFVAASIMLAKAEMQALKFDDSEARLTAVLKRDELAKSDVIEAKLTLISSLIMHSKWEDARKLAQSSMEEHKDELRFVKALLESYFVPQEYSQSIDYFLKALESDAENMSFHHALIASILKHIHTGLLLEGDSSIDESSYKLLSESIAKAMQLSSSDAKLWLFQGLAHMMREEYGKAEIDILTAERLAPNDWMTKFAVHYLSTKSDDPVKRNMGVNELKRMAQSATLVEQFLCLGASYRSMGMHKEAWDLNESAIERDPARLRYLSDRLSLAVLSKDYEAAERAIEALEARKFVLPNHLYSHARLLYEQGKLKKAIELMTEAILKDQSRLRYTSFMALLYFDSGMFEASKQYFETVLSQNPMDANAQYYLGRCNMELGNKDLAAQNFQRAIEIDPSTLKAQYGLGLTLLDLDRRNEAMRAFSAVIERYQGDGAVKSNSDEAAMLAAAYMQRALLFKTNRRKGEAREDFKSALAIKSDEAELSSQYAIFLYELGDDKASYKEIQRLRSFAEPDAAIYYLEGVILLKQHKAKEALSALEASRDLDFAQRESTGIIGLQDSADIYLRLAFLYRDMGKKGLARESMEIYLQRARILSPSARKELELELSRM
ncbi:MAG: tetratricopeptide repeat protein [Bradymonadales bacterium]|jgi:tetratricopeptide (TPR) repeat protein